MLKDAFDTSCFLVVMNPLKFDPWVLKCLPVMPIACWLLASSAEVSTCEFLRLHPAFSEQLGVGQKERRDVVKASHTPFLFGDGMLRFLYHSW